MLNFKLESLKDNESLAIAFNTFNLKQPNNFDSSAATNQWLHNTYKTQSICEGLISIPFQQIHSCKNNTFLILILRIQA
jgi:hypothetical protein